MSVLFEFFERLDREKWSGEVHITSSQGHAYLLFKEGQLIWSHRPLDRAIERMRKIEWLHLPPEEILASTKSWESLVRDLISTNQDQYSRLIRFFKTERVEIFFRVFFWSNVELIPRTFEVTLPDPVTFGFYRPRKLSLLLEEAKHRLKEWPVIQERMGSSKRVFVSSITLPELDARQIDEIDRALMNADEGASPQAALKGLPYSPEEIELLRLCDGTANVQEIIKASLDGEYLVLRRLMNLWNKGAIRPKDEEHSEQRHIAPVTSTLSNHRWYDSIWVALWIAVLSLTLSILQGLSPSVVVVPTSLTQAIEVFRFKHGHYPLSLEELAAEPSLRELPIQAFHYALLRSDEYEITLKR